MSNGRAVLASSLALALPACAATQAAGRALPSTDPGIPAAVVESWGMQAQFFRSRRFEMVSWEEAQKVLLARECIGGKQYHTGWITIYARDGKRYLVKPPATDDLFSFFRRSGLKGDGFAPE